MPLARIAIAFAALAFSAAAACAETRDYQPRVLDTRPLADAADVAADQVFLLELSRPLAGEPDAMCNVEGIRSGIPVAVLAGEERERALAQAQVPAPGDWLALRCKTHFPDGARVSVVWQRPAPQEDQNNPSEYWYGQAFHFTARTDQPFSVNCSRENEGAGCNPVAPVTLTFPVTLDEAQAKAIYLRDAQGHIFRPAEQEQRENYYGATSVAFPRLPPAAVLTVRLPAGLKDHDGKPLSAGGKPYPVYRFKMADYPPLVKFAADFGIIERNADPALPVTLRNLEAAPQAEGTAAKLRTVRLTGEADIVAALREVQGWQGRDDLRAYSDQGEGDEEGGSDFGKVPKIPEGADSRGYSMLKGRKDVTTRDLPKPLGPKPMEVVGLPLPQPGFYVVEAESRKLGRSLLDRDRPMYVRTAALVTNLATHLHYSDQQAVVWVTTLDRAAPVAGAAVTLRTCKGKILSQGKTDAQGIYVSNAALPADTYACPMFAFARLDDDLSFVRSDWTRGIEPWRFRLENEWEPRTRLGHTVLARNLLRPGETVYMKHYARQAVPEGLAYPKAADLPKTVDVSFDGGEDRYAIPVTWDARGDAETVWKLPEGAKRGVYSVSLGNFGVSATFRVADFRLPALKGEVAIPQSPLVAPDSVGVDLRLSYLSGGPAGGEKVTLRQRFAPAHIAFPAYPDHLFGDSVNRWSSWFAEREGEEQIQASATPEGGESAGAGSDATIALSAEGTARATIRFAKPVTRPRTLIADMEYRDPNGETYTAQARSTLWPAARAIGIKADDWAAVKGKTSAELLVLDLAGKPVAGTPVAATAAIRGWVVHRKRSVGGFYAYHQEEFRDELGQVCSGKTGKDGKFQCVVATDKSGELLLKATTADQEGRESQATTSLWVYQGDDSWFRADDHDRFDVVPEKKHYEPGETARLQLRLPFPEATALVAVMRTGGMLDRFVRQVSRKDPVIELPVKPGYAPNVYVSVLLVRGRAASPAPTAMVDLARPAFKLGIAELEVGSRKYRMKVSVTTDKPVYQARDKARAHIKVEGAPDAGGRRVLPSEREVAVFAIDEALLELMPNNTWDALPTMLTKRHYGFNTATAQMQVVGKRHYGRKALPPGGGGGRAPTRELFDTLLLWQGKVKLDEHGEADVDVPLNDSLTRFRIVAVADAGPDEFGMGYASITANKDLQLLSGLPALVRDGDRLTARFTARNATGRAMRVKAWGSAGTQPLAEQTLDLGAGESKGVAWQVVVPAGSPTLEWRVNASEAQGRSDAVRIVQAVEPALSTVHFLSTGFDLKDSQTVALDPPRDAAPGRSTVLVGVAPELGASAASVREYMRGYPFACLEQRTSKAVTLKDGGLWAIISSGIGRYIADDGLVNYYPNEGGQGYDVLTAFVLSASKDVGWELPPEARDKMLSGLVQFVQGKLVTNYGYYRNDSAELTERKLLALGALSRFGQARPEMADSLKLDPAQLSTRALIEWTGVLQRTQWPERDTRLKAALAELKRRYTVGPDGAHFTGNINDERWWLMYSDDVTAVKLLLLALDTPELAPDVDALARAAVRRQHDGRWWSTQADVWGSLAFDKYAEHVSRSTLSGKTVVRLGKETREVVWAKTPMGDSFRMPLIAGNLNLEQQGNGTPYVQVVASAFAPLASAMASQAALDKTILPLRQTKPGVWSVGDVVKVKFHFVLNKDSGWLVLSDPIPAGATILGGGLKGLESLGEPKSEDQRRNWRKLGPVFEERSFGAYRAYYEYLPHGDYSLEYEMRLNNAGDFHLPPTHLEAMYAPEVFADMPNAGMEVK